MDERLTAISRALAYVEIHLKDKLQVEELAEACGYSLYYFIRLFNQCVHLTPYDYLVRRRLTQAALEVLHSRRRLLDIALDFGFQNAETFTRAFYRVFGLQPSQARKQGGLDQRLLLQPCSREQMLYYQACGIPHAQPCSRPSQLLAGFALEQDLAPDRVEQVAEKLRGIQPDLSEFFWVTTYLEPAADQPPTYFAGVAWPDWTDLPAECLAKAIPAGSYARFSQDCLLDYMEMARSYIYQVWTANTGERFAHPLEVCQIQLGDESETHLYLPVFNNSPATF
ncbi:MAG: AraC family transcriptional regulator [Chloroflexota bacterium]|nr:AraC family transcriptional regulator [Chloroflexota bacterium]